MFVCFQMAKPKQKRVEEAKEALQMAQNNLAQKQASLAKVRWKPLWWLEKNAIAF